MRKRLLSVLMLAVVGVGFVGSGEHRRTSGSTTSTRPSRTLEVLEETAEYRLVRHALGQAEVPCESRRIVSLSAAATDSLAALGILPMLVETGWKSAEPPGYMAGRLEGATAVRRAGGISLEAVLDVKPDLILVGSAQDGRIYGQLSKIAPTVVLDSFSPFSREEVVLDVGAIVGVPQRAARRLAAYRERVARAKAKLAKRVGNQPVVFLRFRQHTCVIYAQRTLFGPLLFERLGLTPDPAMPMEMATGGWDVLSIERLSTLRAEHVFCVVDADSETYLASIADTPIWKSVPAVSKGQIHRVAASTWLGGDGILASEAIIDDVLTALAPEGSR
jgi:iron complex transport system substrate-binding protein